MQRRLSRSHCFARFGPDFRFDTAAADSARGVAILEKEHLGAASLRRRTARVGNGGHDDTLAAPVRFANQTIKIVLRNSAHGRWSACILRALRRHPCRPTRARCPENRRQGALLYGLGVGVGLEYGCEDCDDASACAFRFAFSIAA